MNGQIFEMIMNFLKGKQFPDDIIVTKHGYSKLWVTMIWKGEYDDLKISIDYTNNSDAVRWIGQTDKIPKRTPGVHILWDEKINKTSLLEKYSELVVDWNNKAKTKYDAKNEFKMFSEEYLEYAVADSRKDTVEQADATIDMLFVFIGTLHKLGVINSTLTKLRDIDPSEVDYMYEYVGCVDELKKLGVNQPIDIEECAMLLQSLMDQLLDICDNDVAFAEKLMMEVLRSNNSKIEDYLDGYSDSGCPKVGKGANYSEPDLKSIFDKYTLI